MRLKNILVAAALGVCAAAAGPAMQPAPVQMQPAVSRKRKRALFNGAVIPVAEPLRAGRRGLGITMAQQQRAAQKRRNRAKHRRACK